MIIRFERNGKTKYGWVVEERVRVIEGNMFKEGELTVMTGLEVPLKGIKLFPPCEPTHLIAISDYNRKNASEATIIGTNGIINLPDSSTDLHYRVSVGCVIKRWLNQSEVSEADDFIMGLTTVLTVQSSSLEREPLVYLVGPGIVPKLRVEELDLKLIINDEICQVFKIGQLHLELKSILSEISRNTTKLNPGDILLAGNWIAEQKVRNGDKLKLVTDGFLLPLLAEVVEKKVRQNR
jgi:hypothetical protein